jgi:hypothetical protein
MFSLDLLTSVTTSNILGSISLHSIPPISGIEILVHLIPSRIHEISTLMCFTKYLVLQFLDVRHTNLSLIPQHTFLIFQKVRRLLFLDVMLNLLALLILQLAFPNLLK